MKFLRTVISTALILYSAMVVAKQNSPMSEHEIRTYFSDYTTYSYSTSRGGTQATYNGPDGKYHYYCCEHDGWKIRTTGTWSAKNGQRCFLFARREWCSDVYSIGDKVYLRGNEILKRVKGHQYPDRWTRSRRNSPIVNHSGGMR